MNHKLIRFDVRLERAKYVDEFWNAEHRSRFLLKEDVAWPLSVDPLVWPSVFYSQIFKEANKLPYGSIEVSPSTDEGNYWHSLREMASYYAKHKKPDTGGIPIAVEIVSESNLDSDQLAMTFGNHIDPAEPPPGSEFLGFDVADLSGISALCNCEYSHDAKAHLVPLWAPRLNVFGLLTTPEHAVEFREFSNRRVSEHSPFWVYGIWRIPVTS